MHSPPTDHADFYSEDIDEMTRGALLLQSRVELVCDRIMHGDVSVDTPVSKQACLRFPYTASAPMKPTDPLYVFSNWNFCMKGESVSDLANLIIDGIEGVISRRCKLVTNVDKMKIAVDSESGLSMKVKFFALPGESQSYLVMFRKDSGDWFAFQTIYNACLKHLVSKGVPVELVHQRQ